MFEGTVQLVSLTKVLFPLNIGKNIDSYKIKPNSNKAL